MRIPIYQVDAFTGRLFHGNPAAVCPLEAWLPDELLQAIAAENNLSETAFLVREAERYRLRWFTPAIEVSLCGHATLAAAFVLFNRLEPGAERVVFNTLSGELAVTREGELLAMDFPAKPPRPCDPPPGLLEALGGEPIEALKADYFLVTYEDERAVRALRPDFRALAALGAAVIVAGPGEEVDFVSRFFAPAYGIDEDPVTGSAHCTLIPFYAQRLGKSSLTARQVSRRGGELFCEHRGERVKIAGRAVLYLEGSIILNCF
jgi:PhzF family phenazine biosynthesis protein